MVNHPYERSTFLVSDTPNSKRNITDVNDIIHYKFQVIKYYNLFAL